MYKSILCAVDGSSYTQSVLDCGIDLAGRVKTELRVLSVVDIRMFEWVSAISLDGFVPAIPGPNYLKDSRDVLEAKARKTLDKAGEKIKEAGIDIVSKIEFGVPQDVICDEARKSDLLIMGRRGEFAHWSGQLVGATLEAVTHSVSRPLLVVDEEFTPFSEMICAYDGSECSSRALRSGMDLAVQLGLKVAILSAGNEETAKERLEEAAEYCKPYDISVEYIWKNEELVEALTEIYRQKPDAVTVMGSHGKSRIREAILGSTTLEVLRKLKHPVIIQR
jgi:nucleotide-binding universal stress UspA family protein